MLGATTFAENAIADQGILFFGVSEQSGISSSANAAVGIMSGVATTDFNMTLTSSGGLLYENINAGATEEEYTTISPSGTESWTTVTPSGSETWTEIEA